MEASRSEDSQEVSYKKTQTLSVWFESQQLKLFFQLDCFLLVLAEQPGYLLSSLKLLLALIQVQKLYDLVVC